VSEVKMSEIKKNVKYFVVFTELNYVFLILQNEMF